jgi:hypothetical protein
MPTLTGLFGSRTMRQRFGPISAAVRQWGDSDAFDFDRGTRLDKYLFNRAMLENKAYWLEARGGWRETILKDTFAITCTEETKLVGVYNPVRAIVDVYQNVFRGSFGQDIKIDDKVDDLDVNPLLVKPQDGRRPSPLRQIWKSSLLDTEKHTLQEWAANLGSVGLRIVARNNIDPAQQKVFIQVDHPATIAEIGEEGGNVVWVELKYNDVLVEPGSSMHQVVEVREVLTKTRFVKEVGGKNVLEPDEQRNELGVCPYVLLRHGGSRFGRWAYAGSEDIIHWINWIATNKGESIVEHAWPEWFAAAGGNAPEEFQFGRSRIKYVKMDPDTPPPMFEPKVANLDYAGSLAYLVELITRLMERNPELIIAGIKVLAGQSGETIAKLQTATEQLILRARSQYENAVIRANQIALSEGIRMGMWDIGTGSGNTESADRAYKEGFEEFAFAERAALPPTAFDQVQQANADTARQSAKLSLAKQAQGVGVDQQTTLEHAFTPQEVQQIMQRKSTQDTIPTEPL